MPFRKRSTRALRLFEILCERQFSYTEEQVSGVAYSNVVRSGAKGVVVTEADLATQAEVASECKRPPEGGPFKFNGSCSKQPAMRAEFGRGRPRNPNPQIQGS